MYLPWTSLELRSIIAVFVRAKAIFFLVFFLVPWYQMWQIQFMQDSPDRFVAFFVKLKEKKPFNWVINHPAFIFHLPSDAVTTLWLGCPAKLQLHLKLQQQG